MGRALLEGRERHADIRLITTAWSRQARRWRTGETAPTRFVQLICAADLSVRMISSVPWAPRSPAGWHRPGTTWGRVLPSAPPQEFRRPRASAEPLRRPLEARRNLTASHDARGPPPTISCGRPGHGCPACSGS